MYGGLFRNCFKFLPHIVADLVFLVFALAKLEVVKVRKTLDGKHSNDFISTGDGEMANIIVPHFLICIGHGLITVHSNKLKDQDGGQGGGI